MEQVLSYTQEIKDTPHKTQQQLPETPKPSQPDYVKEESSEPVKQSEDLPEVKPEVEVGPKEEKDQSDV